VRTLEEVSEALLTLAGPVAGRIAGLSNCSAHPAVDGTALSAPEAPTSVEIRGFETAVKRVFDG
jgi:hypothetical protein